MRYVMKLLMCVLLVVAALGVAHADSRTDIGMSFGSEGLRSFYLAIGEHYRVPERHVLLMRDRHISDYDMPVVLFIANRARVAPEVVMDFRLSGRSWMDITLHFGLSPDIYYVPVHGVYGPPYGHAYGHYKNKNHKYARLDDDDVVNMVNLRFISERYGYSPDEVIRMRSGGKNFVVINDEIRQRKEGKRSGDDGKSWDKHERQDGDKHERKDWDKHEKSDKHQGKGNGKNKERD